MCSVTAMRPARFEPYLILHSQSCWSAGLLALWRRADPSHPIPTRMWSAPTAPDGDPPAFPLVSLAVEPPAGIEPATPSLPSMRRWFTPPRTTSCTHTTARVRGAVEGCIVGRSEVARSTVSGKSLARPARSTRHARRQPNRAWARWAMRSGRSSGIQWLQPLMTSRVRSSPWASTSSRIASGM